MAEDLQQIHEKVSLLSDREWVKGRQDRQDRLDAGHRIVGIQICTLAGSAKWGV